MPLTRAERDRITESRLRLQAVSDSLSHIDPQKVPEFDAIQECLQGAEKNLFVALRSQPEK